MTDPCRITEISEVTHDVRRLTVEKPEGYRFEPGQATEVAIDKEDWRDEKRPFTFTSLNDWPALEFTIKVYPDHNGVTEQVGKLQVGDRLLIDDAWGTIRYGGPGVFIAGGAGVTPFIAILRDLDKKGQLDGNRLIFSNKTEKDIILREEFEGMTGLDCLFTVTEQPDSPLALGMVDKGFLERHVSDFGQKFYVCGPPKMVEDVSKALQDLGAESESVVFEE
jgi:ferredoxin-NADP reductase